MQAIGPYQVQGELGRGGVGVVLRALDPRTGESVAIKVLTTAGGAESVARRRFLREAEALSRLSHRSIVRIRDAGEHQGLPYLVMDLIEGESLQARIERAGRLRPAEAAQLAHELARALGHAHRAGIVHRDVKPGNVLIGRDGAPRLVDFGLVRDLDPARSALSRTGVYLGTPGFWPPEQATGQVERIGPASDVYSLGATIYAALTGRPPFRAESLPGHIQAVERDAPERPSRLVPGLDPELERIVLRCLEKDPARRYPTAGALGDALEGFLEGRRAISPFRAHLPAMSAAAIVTIGLGAAALMLLGRRPDPTGTTTSPPTSATPGPGDPSVIPPDHLLQEAERRVKQGRVEEARALLAEHLARSPLDARARRSHGLALVMLDRREEALPELESALSAGQDDATLRAALSMARLSVRDVSGALAEARIAHDRDPSLSVAAQALGEALEANGDLIGAEQALGRSMALASDRLYPRLLLLRGGVRMKRGDLRGALDDLDAAVGAAPGEAVYLEKRAAIHIQAGDHEKALSDLGRVVMLAPSAPGAHQLRAEALLFLARYGDALAAIDAALAHRPSARGLVLRSKALAALRRYGEAEADCAQALKLDPTCAAAYDERGQLRALRNDGEGALADLDQAIAIEPREPAFYAARAELRRALEDGPGAIEDGNRAIELAPRDDHILYLVTRTLARLGAPQADDMIDRALERRERPDLRAMRAVRRRARGEFGKACQDYDVLVKLAPNEPTVLVERAHLRRWMRQYQAAVEDATRALQLDPGLGTASLVRGLARLAMDDLAGAATDAKDALLRVPQVADTHLLAGLVAGRRELWDEAEAELQKSLDIVPDQVEVLLTRAGFRVARGDRSGARADLDRAVETSPRNARAALRRGRHLLELADDPAAALPDLERATRLDPELGEAFLYCGIARDRLNDLAGARRDYDRSLELQPHIDAFLQRAALRLRQEDHAGAEADATAALERDAEIADAWLYRAMARVLRGEDLEGAIADAEKAGTLPGGGLSRETRELVILKAREKLAARKR